MVRNDTLDYIALLLVAKNASIEQIEKHFNNLKGKDKDYLADKLFTEISRRNKWEI